MDYLELINELLVLLLPAAAAALVWIGKQIGYAIVGMYQDREDAATIERIVKSTVDWGSIVYKELDGPAIKAKVVERSLNLLAEKGLIVTELELDTLIEAFYKGIKQADAIVKD